MRFVFLISTLFCFLMARPGHAQPSFDCAKAATTMELAICGSPSLSLLDQQLSETYADARMGVSVVEKQRIRQEQVDWIGLRDQCGPDIACLEERMRNRIAELQTIKADGAVTAGLNGTYCARGSSDMILVEDYGNAIEFSFSSFQGGGHSCGTGRLRAEKSGSSYSVRDDGCTFQIAANGNELTFSASGESGCRAFCGARAAFGNHVFQTTSRRPLPPGWTTAMESGGC